MSKFRGKRSFLVAKKDILKAFSTDRIYSVNDIQTILKLNREYWRIPDWVRGEDFIKLLTQYTPFKEFTIEFENSPQNDIVRYSLTEPNIYHLGASLVNHSFLSHYSAMVIHQLTEQVPKSIFVNRELTLKPSKPSMLTQEGIDAAFSKPQRVSNNIGVLGDFQFFLLNSKFLKREGIQDIKISSDDERDMPVIQVTSLERTLIDIIVRPDYAGGIYEVEKAYAMAKDSVSINRLVALLKHFNYIYPYHQSIGFMLEKTDYKPIQIDLLRRLPMEYNFYLGYNLKELEYSKSWKLYYPKGF